VPRQRQRLSIEGVEEGPGIERQRVDEGLACGTVVVVAGRLAGAPVLVVASEQGTQARRTINTHATIMITVTVLALADIAWRLNDYHSRPVAPAGIATST